MPAYRSAGILKSGAPVYFKFESSNLVKSLRVHNIAQYADYDLYMDIGYGKEQLMLEITNHEVTYGAALYDKAIESNVIQLPPPALPIEVLQTQPTDEMCTHRRVRLKKEL